MDSKKILDREAKQLNRLHFLPHRYKALAIILLIISLFGLGIISIVQVDASFLRELLKSLLLLSMLLISITKEKDEDEYTLRQRAKSYIFAFVVTVLYAIFQPYVDYGVGLILDRETASYAAYNAFVVIGFMLFIQIAFYYLLRVTR